MSSTQRIIDDAERYVRELATDLLRPNPGECLCCYVARQLGEFSCNGTHRHAFAYRDAVAPRATALRERLARVGAHCCDCELFENAYAPADRRLREQEQGWAPSELPPCAGVRRGSTRPCANWVRVRWHPLR